MSLDFETPRFNELNEGWNLPKPELKGSYRARICKAGVEAVFQAIGFGKKTNTQIRVVTGFERKTVCNHLQRLLDAKRIHIVGYLPPVARGRSIAVYSRGDYPSEAAVRIARTRKRIVPKVEIVRHKFESQNWCSALFATPIAF